MNRRKNKMEDDPAKKKVVNFRLDEELARRLKAKAAIEGTSVQALFEKFVADYVAEASPHYGAAPAANAVEKLA
jgi:predicted DNA binding CopG/RHH family protein